MQAAVFIPKCTYKCRHVYNLYNKPTTFTRYQYPTIPLFLFLSPLPPSLFHTLFSITNLLFRSSCKRIDHGGQRSSAVSPPQKVFFLLLFYFFFFCFVPSFFLALPISLLTPSHFLTTLSFLQSNLYSFHMELTT